MSFTKEMDKEHTGLKKYLRKVNRIYDCDFDMSLFLMTLDVCIDVSIMSTVTS